MKYCNSDLNSFLSPIQPGNHSSLFSPICAQLITKCDQIITKCYHNCQNILPNVANLLPHVSKLLPNVAKNITNYGSEIAMAIGLYGNPWRQVFIIQQLFFGYLCQFMTMDDLFMTVIWSFGFKVKSYLHG